ncbi:hypothetical protein FBU30_004717 [Linnemannia zychae]|nr:hypothetical protein FBU30_004717 [Linnemannia zychae]
MLGEDKAFKPGIGWYKHALIELGPWFGARSWKSILDTLQADIEAMEGPKRQERLNLLREAEQIEHSIGESQLDSKLSQVTEKVQKLVDILREAGRQPGFCGIIFVERRPNAHTMKEFLDECKKFGKDFGLDFIHSAVLTGHGVNGDVGQLQMNVKQQRKIVEGFRKGLYNLLIATDVAEEGLDIERCRFVIRFDVKNTVISHIQSRGRARDRKSEYVIMLPQGDGFYEKIKKAEEEMRRWCAELPSERIIRLHGYSTDYYEDDDEDENFALEGMKELASAEITYIVPSTGARVNFYTAVSLLHQYCASLPADAYTVLRPEFETVSIGGNFHCKLTLPMNAAATEFHSGPFSKISLAKRAVSFKAIKEIHRLGGLTDRLLPPRKSALQKDDLDEESPESATHGVQGSLHTYPIHQPIFWETKIKVNPSIDSVNLYATIFSIEQPTSGALNDSALSSCRCLCLLTASPLPQFEPIELFFDGNSRFVQMNVLSESIEFTIQQTYDLYQYHNLLFATVFRKPVEVGNLETGVRHLIAPVVRQFTESDLNCGLDLEGFIDWDEIHLASACSSATAGFELQADDLHWDRLYDMVLFERGQTNRFYYTIELRSDMTPKSLIPHIPVANSSRSTSRNENTITRESDPAAANTTFAEYYLMSRDTEIQQLDQPLIEVIKVPRRIDNLQKTNTSYYTPKTTNSAARFLIPELARRCPISASVFRSASWMVSVLIRIDDLLKTTEYLSEFRLLQGGQMKVPLMLEALTASDCSYAMNYQRLELLGDTFLKFMVTIDLFIRYPLLDEGRLTLKRTSRISNSYLFKRSRLHRLDRFIVKTPPINRHFFVPVARPPSGSEEGDSLDQSPQSQQQQQRKSHFDQQISTKTMADLVESTLGAAYLSQGLDLGLKAAAALLRPLEGIRTWSDFARSYSFQTINNLDNPNNPFNIRSIQPFVEDPLLGDLKNVEDAIGYRFKNRRLLVEALTHATAIKPQTPCYQRLEFLGDSVLDMLVADYWVRRYPVSGPGVLHEIKSASINNQILGVICIQLGLHQHILHSSSSLASDIHRARQLIKDAQEDAKSDPNGPRTTKRGEPIGEYWYDFNLTKVLGDVLESVFGAVYVDSEWNYNTILGLFERTVLPTLKDHISIETITKHPIVALLHRVQKDGCQAFRLKNLATVIDGEDQENQDPHPFQSSTSPVVSPVLEVTQGILGSPEMLSSTTPLIKPTLQSSGESTPSTPTTRFADFQGQQLQEKIQTPDQVCTVLVHGQPVVTASHPRIHAARKAAAKRALELLDSDPEWLGRYCKCPTLKARSENNYRQDSDIATVAVFGTL